MRNKGICWKVRLLRDCGVSYIMKAGNLILAFE